MSDSQESNNSGKWIAAMATVLVAIITTIGVVYRPDGDASKKTFTFSGVVRGPDRLPVSNASIQITIGQQTPQSTRSDSSGVFHVEVPSSAQSLHITVYAAGFPPFDVDANPHRTGPEPIELPPIQVQKPQTDSETKPPQPSTTRRGSTEPNSGITQIPQNPSTNQQSLSSEIIPNASFIQSPVPDNNRKPDFTDPYPEANASNPGTLVTIRVDGTFSRPSFEVSCNNPCALTKSFLFKPMGSTGFVQITVVPTIDATNVTQNVHKVSFTTIANMPVPSDVVMNTPDHIQLQFRSLSNQPIIVATVATTKLRQSAPRSSTSLKGEPGQNLSTKGKNSPIIIGNDNKVITPP
jgi:hypothetical protein